MLCKILKQYEIENKPENIFTGSPALETKLEHVEHVEKFGKDLLGTTKHKMDHELFIFCLRHHDDGRVDQFRILGKFWDTEISHNSLGVERFDRWLTKKGYTSIGLHEQIFRDVLLYHGRPHLCFTKASKPYVELVTAADDLENASACISYLLREVAEDAKGYIYDNPEADQKYVSDFVFDHFSSGIKFDKMEHCHTYGEYVLFAATLMTSCIKMHNFARELLHQPGYGYPSILSGYKHIFEETLHPETAGNAFAVLKSYAGI